MSRLRDWAAELSGGGPQATCGATARAVSSPGGQDGLAPGPGVGPERGQALGHERGQSSGQMQARAQAPGHKQAAAPGHQQGRPQPQGQPVTSSP